MWRVVAWYFARVAVIDGAVIHLNACILSSIAWSFCCSVWFFVLVFYIFSCPVSVIRSWPHSIFGISISSHVALLGTCSITITRHFTALQYKFLFAWGLHPCSSPVLN